MTDLPWIIEARKFIGLKEKTGKNDHPKLDAGWVLYGQAWLKGQAWCGLFVKHCLTVSKRHVVPLWFRANSWNSNSMTKLERAAYGCIVTFTRQGGGHVGFVVGRDAFGNLMVLGGNQSNKVSIAPFAVSRVTGYYWASTLQNGKVVKSAPSPIRYELPLLNSNGEVSANEA